MLVLNDLVEFFNVNDITVCLTLGSSEKKGLNTVFKYNKRLSTINYKNQAKKLLSNAIRFYYFVHWIKIKLRLKKDIFKQIH